MKKIVVRDILLSYTNYIEEFIIHKDDLQNEDRGVNDPKWGDCFLLFTQVRSVKK